MNEEIDGTIYSIRNVINNRIYIGQTTKDYSSYIRWNHINRLNTNKHKNSHLQSSWNKHGSKNFEFKVLYRGIKTRDLLDYFEYILINYYRGGMVYNKKDGGNTSRYSEEARLARIKSGIYKKTAEWRKKIGESNRGRDSSPAWIASVKSRRGKSLTEEHKRKCSQSLKRTYFLKNVKTNEIQKFSGKCSVVEYISNINSENNFLKKEKINADKLFRVGKNKYFELYV